MKVNASLIKNYMRCPLQAKFHYIDNIPQKQGSAASFGSAVHMAVDLYNQTGDVQAAKQCFLYIWDHADEFGLEPEIWNRNTSYGQYRERGVAFIDGYHQESKWVNKDVIATEYRFCVPFRNHFISGIVDILESPHRSNVLKVVDLKTGYRPNASNLGFDIQFTSYIWAVSQREFWVGFEPEAEKYPGFENGEELFDKFSSYDILGVWYDLRKSKEYEVGPRSERDYDRLHRCLDEIEKAVNLEVFVPNISGDSCGICSYQSICSVYSGLENDKELT